MRAAGADQQATVPRPLNQREVGVMSPYEIDPNSSDQYRIERHCKIIASGSDHFCRVPGTIAPESPRRRIPMTAAWKSIWIACIVMVAGMVTNGVAISRSGTVDATQTSAATVPVQTAPHISPDRPKCRAAKRNIAAYSQAVGLLDPWRASHRRLAAIYHEAWQAKHDWYQKNCR